MRERQQPTVAQRLMHLALFSDRARELIHERLAPPISGHSHKELAETLEYVEAALREEARR